MAAPASISRDRDRYWIVPLVRAIVALAAGALITFTALHSPHFGLLVFGGLAVVSGILVAVISRRTVSDPVASAFFVAQGSVGILAGALAVIFSSAGLPFYLYLVMVWAAVTGFIELYCGMRRPRTAESRDWRVIGALTAILAIVFLMIPADSVLAVGLFGVYAVVLGVYLAIAGFSLKWGTQRVAHEDPPYAESYRTESYRAESPGIQKVSDE